MFILKESGATSFSVNCSKVLTGERTAVAVTFRKVQINVIVDKAARPVSRVKQSLKGTFRNVYLANEEAIILVTFVKSN